MELSYLNARIRGWRGGLLGTEDYNRLISTTTSEEVIGLLRQTRYGRDIDASSIRIKSEGGLARDVINAAIKARLESDFECIWNEAPVEARPLIKAVFSAWEVYDIKTILRAIKNDVKKDEFYVVLLPIGEFDAAALKALSNVRDVPDLVSMLATWGSVYSVPLGRGLSRYMERREIAVMERELDRFAYSHYLASITGGGYDYELIRSVIRDRIDATNIMTLIKVAGYGYPDDEVAGFFIEDGKRLSLKAFIELASSKTPDELFGGLSVTLKQGSWSRLFSELSESYPDIIGQALEDLTARRLAVATVVDPLSIAVVAHYIYSVLKEARSLRLIVRAIEFSMPENAVRDFVLGTFVASEIKERI